MKKCLDCGPKPVEDFGKDKSRKDGLNLRCRACVNIKSRLWCAENPEKARANGRAGSLKYRANHLEEVSAKTRAWQIANPDMVRAHERVANLKRHGITQEQFDKLLLDQNGCCAICGTDKPGGRTAVLHIDHDHACCPGTHSCGKCICGLLCHNCNVGSGQFNDDPELTRKATTYLERTRKKGKPES